MWEVVHKQGWPWKNWCFWIVVIEDNLESPLDNKSILKEINPEYSLEELMLMLKVQYFGQLMQISDSLGKTLMLERLRARQEGDRQWHGYIASPTQWTWIWANSRRQRRTRKPGMPQSIRVQTGGHHERGNSRIHIHISILFKFYFPHIVH